MHDGAMRPTGQQTNSLPGGDESGGPERENFVGAAAATVVLPHQPLQPRLGGTRWLFSVARCTCVVKGRRSEERKLFVIAGRVVG